MAKLLFLNPLTLILPKPIRDVIDEFSKLPGIGGKTAGRLAFFLLHQKDEHSKRFGEALLKLKENLVLCNCCQNISEAELCHICEDQTRDRKTICVVGEPLDTVALEKSGVFKGLYHILHGNISPLDNIGPDDLKIRELMNRIENDQPEELILATNPTLEGEATANFIQQKIKPFEIRITRIARGLPVGGDIEYADETTIMRALEGRMNY